jgi:hypothetical protein
MSFFTCVRFFAQAHDVGVGVMAEEVGQLQRLFEFLEEHLDTPAATVEIGDGLRAPSHVVGQKNHFPEFAVHLDQSGDAAQFDRIKLFVNGLV